MDKDVGIFLHGESGFGIQGCGRIFQSGAANTYAMYKPKMIAVSTTCMAEVIGDDLNAFIKTSKEYGGKTIVPVRIPAPSSAAVPHAARYCRGFAHECWYGTRLAVPKMGQYTLQGIVIAYYP